MKTMKALPAISAALIAAVAASAPNETMKGPGVDKDLPKLVEKKARPLEWLFPSGDNTPHEGMAFADGVTGVLAWGGGDTLKLTASRADLWDHRGGYKWTDAQSYTNITDAILKGDKARLLGLFKKETPPGEPRNPFMLPLGRVEVKIPGATLKRGTLDVKTGLGIIEFELGGKSLKAELAMSKASRAFALKLPDGVKFEAKAINAMELGVVKNKLAPLGYKDAEYNANGFKWALPADESVSLAFEKNGAELAVRTWRGESKGAFAPAPFAKVRGESAAYWAKFWQEGARVKVPDPVIQGMFDYGMYRFGAMTDPDGVPAGLQGPWIEDNDLPPWSGDYHFNINVQECYAPAYRGGHFANMMPLFRMILSWKPILRDNARKFAGVDGYVLPHSVSDRGVNIGGFWAGTIDHGSTAWVADMMWRYVKYSGDVEFLRRDAYDYMSGAMRVYRAMMVEDGKGALAFPTGPSPEWGGADFNKAVGRNPSFQLAAAHRLARDLIAAAAMLGEKPDAMWLDVEKRLPLASVGETGIEIFEGRPLSASHRHHSHMAGLFPFDIFDLSDPEVAAYVEKTYRQWRAKGDGGWTGWCVPWAAVLNTHAGRAADAVDLLHKWNEYFTNPGHASRHNKWKPGFGGGFGKYPEIGKDGRHKGHEVMQMDGQCAFTAAVLEMMAHEVNGKTEFFKGCPEEWKDVSFENIALSDGRRASGARIDGKIDIRFSDGSRFKPCGMDTVATDYPEKLLREYEACVKPDTSPDRVKTPLKVDMERIGTLRPRSVGEIRGSNWTLGCETLDRDFAVFDEYKRFLAPLGIKTIRLQAGWAKCEREKGKYDFAWLDRIIDYVRAQGINVLLETGYGNPVYKGGGGHDLAGGFPASDEALAAWDAWVDAMTMHFKGRVRDWAMWNEPDIGGNKTVEDIVAFNVRTARIVKRNIPDARIAGLSLARNNPEYLEKCLKEMGDDVALFDWFIYHGYAPAPESSYKSVEMQKEVLAKYSPKAKMRQGENGCPSEMATKFTLSGIPWSEYSQAKWDMRRMLGDLGHDVESSVFTICDFNHKGKEINLKGLLRANFSKEVVAVKRAYYAVQNVAGIFDDTLERVKNSRFGTRDATLSTYEYKKADGRRLLVFWTHADETVRQDKEYKPKYKRPGDSFETRPAVFKYPNGKPFKEPVWIDLLTGRVYAFPKEKQIVVPGGVIFVDVPVYDSPCLLAERGALEIVVTPTCRPRGAARPCRGVRFSPLAAGTMLYGDPVHLVDGKPFAKDPTVIRHGGRYLMYYSVNDGGSWGGAIAESTNLVDWARVCDIAVEGAPFKGGWVAPCVKKFDGKIHLFAQNPAPGVSKEKRKGNRIWHATSDDGIHFRMAAGGPIIEAKGKWSNGRAIDAEAYRAGDKMMMAFATRSADGETQLQGLACSPYGCDYCADKWTELTMDKPLLAPELPWEGRCIEAASVVEHKGAWYMFYAGAYNHERQQIGLAWSADGADFERWRDSPVLPHGAEGSWNAWESGHPGVFKDDDGQIYLFYQGKATPDGGYRLSCLKVEFVE